MAVIPDMTEYIIDKNIKKLIDSGLKKEIAVFLLGSLVYESPNKRQGRKFSSSSKSIEGFESYLFYFIKCGILLNDSEPDFYIYDYEVDWNRYLIDYNFDSITVRLIIEKEFPNLDKHLKNVLEFLKPNFQIT